MDDDILFEDIKNRRDKQEYQKWRIAMEKWEYLSCEISNTAVKIDQVIFLTTNKINFDDVLKNIPGCERARDALGRNGFKNNQMGPFSFQIAILDYLGNLGWELVDREGGSYYLKRKLIS